MSSYDARQLARELRLAEERIRARIPERSFETVHKESIKGREGEGVEKARKRAKKDIWPAIGHLGIDEITTPMLIELHRQISERAPYVANRCIEDISAVYSYAIRCGYVSANPAAPVPQNREEKRERYLAREELPKLLRALEAEPFIARSAIILMLLTGARKNEILSLKWSQIRDNTIHLENTKNGKGHRIKLSPIAREVVAAIAAQTTGEYLFPSPKKSKHGYLATVHKAWHRTLERAGLCDLRVHDLRRTVGSWLANEDVSLATIGKVLNHSSISSSAIYARLSHETAAKALEKFSLLVEDARNSEQPTRPTVQ